MTTARASAALVIDVTGSTLQPGWEPGPWPVNARSGAHGTEASEARLRSTYFDHRATRRLYGSQTRPTRWWRSAERPFDGRLGECAVPRALELLDLGDADGAGDLLLVVHVELDRGDPATALAQLVNLRPPGLAQDAGPLRRWVDELPGLQVRPDAVRAYSVAFVTWDGDDVPATRDADAAGDGWSAAELWSFRLASATAADRYPIPHGGRDELLRHRLRLSRDWEALVLRDGAAFVGLHPDSTCDFYAAAQRYVSSIYLDALLFGVAQQRLLGRFADRLASLGVPTRDARSLQQIERDLNRFRNEFLWQHITRHGHASDVLLAYREQHRLDALAEQVTAEVTDYATQVQTSVAMQTNALLVLLTLVTLPAAVVLPLLDVADPGGVPTAVVLALAAVAVLTLAVRFRRLLAPLADALR